MRFRKSYLIIGILLLLAVASWSALLSGFLASLYERSPAEQKAEIEAFWASFLHRQLPQMPYDLQLVLDGTDGKPVQMSPVLIGKPLTAKQMNSPEWKEQEKWVPFLLAMSIARKTTDHEAWKRLGEAHIASTNGNSSVVLQVYEAPGGRPGFEHEGSFYGVKGDACNGFADFIREARNRKAP